MIDLNEKLGMIGKTVIVTGAASGTGAEVARFFSDVGACVALFDTNTGLGQKQAESITDQGGKARFYQCDVANAKAVFFFLSDLSRWVTGPSLVVDGGGLA